MEVRLLDSGLADIRGKLNKFAKEVIKKKYKANPDKCRLYVVFKRGDIEMKNGEWLKNPELSKKLTLNQATITSAFDKKNLNMGILGYGNPKDGLKGLMQWVKHNVNPAKIKGDNRDLKIDIESIRPGKNGKSAQIVLRVPEKGMESSSDLKNVKLEELGYEGLKKWTSEQLEKIKDSDKAIDKIIYNVLTGKAKLKTKVEEVIKSEKGKDN